jgi:hypothetical protein
MSFEFNWSKFTEDKYAKAMESWVKDSFNDDFIGAVNVGDICIELVNGFYIDADDNEVRDLLCNFYVRHEDTGYSWEDAPVPYDHADGTFLPIPYGLTYEEFKANAEKVFTEYIVVNDKQDDYSLVEHANRPLEIW